MSKISLTPNASGTGTLSIASPSTNSDYTLTLPAETGTVVVTDGTTLVVDNSGDKVGVGTTSPQSTVGVNVGLNDTKGVVLQYSGDAKAGMLLYPSGGEARFGSINSSGTYFTTFYANNTERMRIDSSGNFMVGATSAGAKFHLRYDGNATVGQVCDDTYASAGTNKAIQFKRNNSEVGTIGVTTTSTAYNTSSDYRLKENVAPMTGALATVAALKPCTYTWKIDGSAGQGFIAHELQAVVPDCVTGEKDAVETYTDEEGNEQTRPVYQGVDTSFLVATLTAAIQELSAKNDALEARIAALEAA